MGSEHCLLGGHMPLAIQYCNENGQVSGPCCVVSVAVAASLCSGCALEAATWKMCSHMLEQVI